MSGRATAIEATPLKGALHRKGLSVIHGHSLGKWLVLTGIEIRVFLGVTENRAPNMQCPGDRLPSLQAPFLFFQHHGAQRVR
jgi:hypothetical protein